MSRVWGKRFVNIVQLYTWSMTLVLPLLVKPNLSSTFCIWHRFPNPITLSMGVVLIVEVRMRASVCQCPPPPNRQLQALVWDPAAATLSAALNCSPLRASTWRTTHGLGPVSEPVKWVREREDISGRETHQGINSCWFLRSPLDATTRTADGSIQNWSKLPQEDLKYQEIASRDFGVKESCADLGGWVCQRRWLIYILENQ